jgi:hypothetical protein
MQPLKVLAGIQCHQVDFPAVAAELEAEAVAEYLDIRKHYSWVLDCCAFGCFVGYVGAGSSW